ncbi:MAG: hypothetical protein GC149_14140 [Gammaproteobacteria bacterium]|nr:hypothetical protein [Gammaproteobacteria bacterium]
MGDYSRNTYQLTNIVHQILSGSTVTDPRHYVAVKMQQGVPLLDADWNDMDDIRRQEARLYLRHYLGNCVPDDADGFRIGAATSNNNFSISTGRAMVDGMLVINENSGLSYTDQATLFGLSIDAITPPNPADVPRTDLVYLDVWEQEIGPVTSDRHDDRLVDVSVGLETARRLERRWLVRVAQDASDLATIATQAGHVYMPLALIVRSTNSPAIAPEWIYDLRTRNINVAQYLKRPFSIVRGIHTFSNQLLVDLLDALRSIYLLRVENDQLFFDLTDNVARTMVLFAINNLVQVCTTAALQARTNNLNLGDVGQVFTTLLAAQREVLTTLSAHNDSPPTFGAFNSDYTARLNVLETALSAQDLIDAYEQQLSINQWLAADVDALPEGDVLVDFQDISPLENLVAGHVYTISIEIRNELTSAQGHELIDVNASLDSSFWTVTPATQSLTLNNVGQPGNSNIIAFQVTPNASDASANLSVIATPRRNSGITSTQPPLALTIGVMPTIGDAFLYNGPPLNSSGQVEIPNTLVTRPEGVNLNFVFRNLTGTTQDFNIAWLVELSTGSITGWVPTDTTPSTTTLGSLGAGSSFGVGIVIRKTGSSAAGAVGTIHITATGVTTSDTATYDLNFIITNA